MKKDTKGMNFERISIGSWIQLGDPEVIKIMIESGFEWLVLDMEHGNVFESSLSRLLDVFEGTDCTPIVRVRPDNPDKTVNRILDLGCKIIIIPGVKNKDDITRCLESYLYPPEGKRGIGFSRANKFGLDFEGYFSSINDEVQIIPQIENKEATENIDSIFSLKDVKTYLIGPYDLTGSLDLIGEFEREEYINAINQIKKSALENNVSPGIHVVYPNVEDLRKAIKDGNKFIAYGTDALLIYEKSRSDLAGIKDFLK